MASTHQKASPIRAGSASKHDPFVNASELDGIALIDLTADDELDHGHLKQVLRVNKSLRNYILDADHQSVKGVLVDGNLYEVGHFVELRELEDLQGIEFIEIKSIHYHEKTGEYVIRGLPYARTRNLRGCLARMQNEVCLILEIDADDARPDEDQALREIGPENILRKRILTNTNKSFPNCRFDRLAYATAKQREEEAPLACRWKMRLEYKDASKRRAGRFQGQAVEHLSERDSHKIKKRNLGVDNDRSIEYRGDTMPGGSTFVKPDFTQNEFGDSEPTRVQKYSLAEVAAGAGGGSRGAEMASFRVVLATESCQHVSKTYRANFPNTELYEMEIAEFVGDKTRLDVDVLHISSSALSAAGDDPESAKKICTDLLNKTLTRFILMDLPASIVSERKDPFRDAIIQSFTIAGYSIEWNLVQMAEYGLPQMRKRVILIGAGPGETLPSWPTATHSSDPTGDQQSFMTEEDAISGLTPELHSLHEPEDMPAMDYVIRDADKPIDTALNSNGSVYHHPDGHRDFTLRELACLQGFPTYHQFEGSYIKKQIGNAFPPSVAMAFFQHIRQHMEESDGIQPELTESGEPAGTPVASGLNIKTESTIESAVYDESPNGPLDAVTPLSSQDVRTHGDTVRSPIRPRRGAAVLTSALPMSPTSPSSRLTMSPKAESDGRPSLPISRTPASAWALPTPSTGGRFVSDKDTSGPQLKRGRDQFEEPESDGDDDDGPQTLDTPSKRPRISPLRMVTRASDSGSSRTCSTSSYGAAGQAEDVSIPDAGGELGGSGPDDQMYANHARGL